MGAAPELQPVLHPYLLTARSARVRRWPTPAGPELSVVASGGWRDGTFHAQLRLVETPHTIELELDPVTGSIRLDWRMVPLTGADPLATVSFPI